MSTAADQSLGTGSLPLLPSPPTGSALADTAPADTPPADAGAPASPTPRHTAQAAATEPRDPPHADIIGADGSRADEHFIPVTRYALVERLTRPQSWSPGAAQDARRLFRYLDHWRLHQHSVRLMRMAQAYEPFSPDSDLFVTRHYTDGERRVMEDRLLADTADLLDAANYISVPRQDIEAFITTRESVYGLDLKVDFEAYDQLMFYYRGASVKKEQRRTLSKFLRHQEFEIPIFRRVFVLFKLKSPAQHIDDVRARMRISHKEAEKRVRRARKHIPAQLEPGCIYLKLFKNMPRSELEMVFPNRQIKFRMLDKLWLGLSGGGAVGAGLFGAAGKLALVFSNPVTAVGAIGGIGAIAFRQVMNGINQKQRYLRVMAEHLYFHSMADNRGAMTKLTERAAEEDFKEDVLLYSVLAKEQVNRADLGAIDEAIEHYLEHTFGLQVDFEVDQAFERLKADGIVIEDADGTLRTLPPGEAALQIDKLWDRVLDDLPDIVAEPGREMDKVVKQQWPGGVGTTPPDGTAA